MKNKKILFIGCGNMGEAVLKSFLDFGFNPKNIFISEKTDKKKQYLTKNYGVNIGKSEEFEILILAIKPQQIGDLNLNIGKNCLVISILAGTKIAKIKDVLSVKKVARIMPNLPLMFGNGMSTFFGENLDKNEKELIIGVFSQSGKIFELESEEKMHQSTLLAGSGPGFYFYFVSIFEKIAKNYGFSEKEAEFLARETMIGSGKVLENSEDSAETWKKRVCSKGGTTESAIEEFKNLGLENIFEKSIKKGVERSEKLGE